MCKLADTIFVEKEGVVWTNLKRCREPERNAPYEEPKQEGLA